MLILILAILALQPNKKFKMLLLQLSAISKLGLNFHLLCIFFFIHLYFNYNTATPKLNIYELIIHAIHMIENS